MLARYAEVVDAIYDCAIDPERWNVALPKIIAITEGLIASIHFIDFSNQRAAIGYHVGTEQPYIDGILSTYGQIWAMEAGVAGWEVARPMHLRDVVRLEEHHRGRFYREWVAPQGQGDYVGMVALREGPRIAKMTNARQASQGDYPAESLEMFRQLAPHICRAAKISDALSLKSLQSSTLEATLQQLACGVFLVDFAGHVVFSNAAGERLLRDATSLALREHRLAPKDAAAADRLGAALAEAVHGGNGMPSGGYAVALPTPGGHGHIATVLPLVRGERQPLSRPFAAAAAVFVQDPSLVLPVPGQAFAQLYHLTPAELRIVLAMVAGLRPQDAADVLGLSLQTVKTHLASVFQKTGTTGQGELMALLARGSGPAGPPPGIEA
jgi:DNA-binding CsgD family transcriptional regulator